MSLRDITEVTFCLIARRSQNTKYVVNFFVLQALVVSVVYWLIGSGYLAISTSDRIDLLNAKVTSGFAEVVGLLRATQVVATRAGNALN